MQSTAQGWLVLELTDSPLALGVVSAVGSLPILLFTLYAGVVADRRDKRSILLSALTSMMIVALAMAVLTDTGRITLPLILLLVLLTGSANAFEVPTRQAFFVELVGRDDLTNAIALNSTAFNLSRIVGPAVAGVLIGSLGIAACFYANAVSYLAVLGGLLLIRRPAPVVEASPASTREHLKEGIDFLRSDRRAGTLVALIAAASILAFPFVVLMPVFARDVLGVGAVGLGTLLSATGAGALVGGVALAGAAGRVPRGPLLLGASTSFCVLLMGIAASRSFPLTLLLLAGAGFTMILNNATSNALLQSLVPDRLRGRVMGVYVFMFLGMAPLGSLQAGILARTLGAPRALAVGATLLLLVVLTVWSRVPELRRIR
jgi:MFS family permease